MKYLILFLLSVNCYAATVLRIDQSNFGWTSYTPTISWSSGVGTVVGSYRRDGENMEIQIRIPITGGVTNSSLTATIPSGYTIDSGKLLAATGSNKIGDVTVYDSGAGWNYGSINYDTSTQFVALAYNASATYLVASYFSSTVPITFAAGDYILMTGKFPIVGWTSNQNAPLLVGSVTSGTTELIRHESAKIRCSSSSSITDQLSASWIASVGNISSGACSVTLTTGYFSTTPICQLSVKSVVGSGYFLFVNPTSTTAVTIGCNIMTSGSATLANCTNEDLFLTCDGLR